jgi:hypothetical protein
MSCRAVLKSSDDLAWFMIGLQIIPHTKGPFQKGFRHRMQCDFRRMAYGGVAVGARWCRRLPGTTAHSTHPKGEQTIA